MEQTVALSKTRPVGPRVCVGRTAAEGAMQPHLRQQLDEEGFLILRDLVEPHIVAEARGRYQHAGR